MQVCRGEVRVDCGASMCVYACVCVRVCACIHLCVNLFMCVYVGACVCTCVHMLARAYSERRKKEEKEPVYISEELLTKMKSAPAVTHHPQQKQSKIQLEMEECLFT